VQVTAARLLMLWKLPFFAVLHIVSAYFLGRILGFVCRIETREATVVRGGG
jgi:hypothetical protein